MIDSIPTPSRAVQASMLSSILPFVIKQYPSPRKQDVYKLMLASAQNARRARKQEREEREEDQSEEQEKEQGRGKRFQS